MRFHSTMLVLGSVIAVGGAVASAAPVQLASFDNFTLDAIYGSWGAPFATLTSGPTAFTVRSHDYGSGYKYLGGEFNAAGNTIVQLEVTVSEGVAGCLVDLVDASNNGQAYRFYGLVPGGGVNGSNDYILQMPIAAGAYFTGTGVLDTAHISQMNIEIDPGPTSAFYTASWNNLSLVPEPTSGAVLLCAGSLLAARRRRI